jgi:programmed cell death protein 5
MKKNIFKFLKVVNQVELQLIQKSSLKGKVTDKQLKILLKQIAIQKDDIKIK